MASAVLMSAVCLAQVQNVKKVQSLIYQEQPDFDQARKLIRDAQQNEETKNDANTWYVAGLIGYKQSEAAMMALAYGQTPDYMTLGPAVIESYDYWLKADELAQVLVQDKKGNMVMDKKNVKLRKQIANNMKDYFQRAEMIQYGVQLNDQQRYSEAFDAFSKYLSIPKLDMMQDAKLQAQMPQDTTFDLYKYYAARFAYSSSRLDDAIPLFRELMDGQVEALASSEFLYQCYIDKGDSTKAEEALVAGMQKFPAEPWFLQNLINTYVFSGRDQLAIQCLEQAIQRDPNNADYYNVMGNIYLNQATKINEKAAFIKDNKEFEVVKAQMDELYKKSQPYFEKAHELAPDNKDYMQVLKGLYYRFQDPRYEEISAALGN